MESLFVCLDEDIEREREKRNSRVQRKRSVNWESEGRSPRPGQFSLLISNIVALMNRGLE